MTEYKWAARMPALQCFIDIEKRDETWRWYDVMHETFFVYVEKEKRLYDNNRLRDYTKWCYDVGCKSLTETKSQGQLYDVIHSIKFL